MKGNEGNEKIGNEPDMMNALEHCKFPWVPLYSFQFHSYQAHCKAGLINFNG